MSENRQKLFTPITAEVNALQPLLKAQPVAAAALLAALAFAFAPASAPPAAPAQAPGLAAPAPIPVFAPTKVKKEAAKPTKDLSTYFDELKSSAKNRYRIF